MLQIDQSLLENVCALLLSKKLKLVTAESCTGGGLSYYLTSLSGSSAWLERGFITYSNEAKVELLNVSPSTLEQDGAVSKNTALQMAEGALMHSKADIAVSITGIAGPMGASPGKPVGTVWIALACKNKKTTAHDYLFLGDREAIRLKTIEQALQLVEMLLQTFAP